MSTIPQQSGRVPQDLVLSHLNNFLIRHQGRTQYLKSAWLNTQTNLHILLPQWQARLQNKEIED
jgi:hypothetical protein